METEAPEEPEPPDASEDNAVTAAVMLSLTAAATAILTVKYRKKFII